MLRNFVVFEKEEWQKLLKNFKEAAQESQDQLCLNLIYRIEELMKPRCPQCGTEMLSDQQPSGVEKLRCRNCGKVTVTL